MIEEMDIPIDLMRLDGTALVALEIFSSGAGAGPSGRFCSIFSLLDKTRTVGGKALLGNWLREPLCDLERINQRLDILEAFNEAGEFRDSMHRDLLRRVSNLTKLSRKLMSKKASLDDCYKIYVCILALESIVDKLTGLEDCCQAVRDLISGPLKQSQLQLDKMRRLIESTVQLDETMNTCVIKPDIDEKLVELQEDKLRLQSEANKVLAQLKADTNTDNIKLESAEDVGFFFRVTLKTEKAIRQQADIQRLKTTKGSGVTFTNPVLMGLSDEIRDVNTEYEIAQREVKNNVIETCESFALSVEVLAERIAVLDVLVSFSVFCSSGSNQFVRPVLLEKGTGVFDLRGCRHPVVENIPFGQSFVPNDIVFDQERRFVILTGPNMGGKSTFIKSAAITVIMAQIGCFVPCTTAKFSLIDGIYCRVGAGDVQSKGISTFMQEMKDVSVVLNNATSNSLVIIDELGRGTSTFDGFGLIYAISDEIVCNIKAFTLLATHFHEMVRLERAYPTMVKSLKVSTHLGDDGSVTMLYKVEEGVSEQSFGINIARMLDFPEDVIKDAERILAELENNCAGEITPTDQKPC